MSDTKLVIDSFTFDPRPNYPLVTTVKRYRRTGVRDDPNALTLVFAHGTGFHKELFEPTIEDLWDMVTMRGGIAIREAWSVDCPNHGEAAVLNEKSLQWGYDSVCMSLLSYHKGERKFETVLQSAGPSTPAASTSS